MSRVALVKVDESIENAVRKSVELAGGLSLAGKKKVVIKPNICNPKNPSSMVITDFKIIETAIGMVREKGIEPLIVESDNIAGTADARVKDSGLKTKLEDWNVRFLNLSNDECMPHRVDDTEISIPRTVIEADYLINLAKMKTCAHTGVTLSIKNLFGCFQEAKKSRLHKKLDEILPYLVSRIRSDMNVVDGVMCMEGNGPTVGNPRRMGVIVAGQNPVSVDSFCSGLMGFRVEEVGHIANSAKMGLGKLQGFEIVGDQWEGFACRFERPYTLKASLKSINTLKEVYLKR